MEPPSAAVGIPCAWPACSLSGCSNSDVTLHARALRAWSRVQGGADGWAHQGVRPGQPEPCGSAGIASHDMRTAHTTRHAASVMACLHLRALDRSGVQLCLPAARVSRPQTTASASSLRTWCARCRRTPSACPKASVSQARTHTRTNCLALPWHGPYMHACAEADVGASLHALLPSCLRRDAALVHACSATHTHTPVR